MNKLSPEIIHAAIAEMSSASKFLLFLTIIEAASMMDIDAIREWYKTIENLPPPNNARQSIRFAEPLIKDLLARMIEKKVLMS